MANESRRVRRTHEAAVDAAVPAVERALEAHGVIKAHGSWPVTGVPAMWLVTTTDAEKSQVLEEGRFVTLVRAELSAAGVPLSVANRAQVEVESIETLDRDYDGSWARLLR